MKFDFVPMILGGIKCSLTEPARLNSLLGALSSVANENSEISNQFTPPLFVVAKRVPEVISKIFASDLESYDAQAAVRTR